MAFSIAVLDGNDVTSEKRGSRESFYIRASRGSTGGAWDAMITIGIRNSLLIKLPKMAIFRCSSSNNTTTTTFPLSSNGHVKLRLHNH